MKPIVAVIGSQGSLGVGITNRLRNDGYSIVHIGRPGSERRDLLDREFFVECDLSSSNAVSNCARTIMAQVASLHGVVVASGSRGKTFSDLTMNDWVQHFTINCVGPSLLCRGLSPLLASGEEPGSVVFISSIAAFIPHSQPDYSSSKSGLIAAARSMAWHLGKEGIRVNCVAPGPVSNSKMTEHWGEDDWNKREACAALGRSVEISDVADTVAFLLSSNAKNLTGCCIDVAAGFHIR